MTAKSTPTPISDLEEAAQGQELFRAPGHTEQMEQAREQAEDSGWLPPEVVYDWPSPESHRRIAARRRHLYEAMQQLEESAARASGLTDWIDEVEKALANLESALEHHVTEIEAEGGLFTEVIDRAPHLAPAVESLRVEHENLLAACRDALDFVSSGDVTPGTLRGKVLRVIDLVTIHRQTGAELLFDTYNVDIAAGD